jgi:hypothetical protein
MQLNLYKITCKNNKLKQKDETKILLNTEYWIKPRLRHAFSHVVFFSINVLRDSTRIHLASFNFKKGGECYKQLLT